MIDELFNIVVKNKPMVLEFTKFSIKIMQGTKLILVKNYTQKNIIQFVAECEGFKIRGKRGLKFNLASDCIAAFKTIQSTAPIRIIIQGGAFANQELHNKEYNYKEVCQFITECQVIRNKFA